MIRPANNRMLLALAGVVGRHVLIFVAVRRLPAAIRGARRPIEARRLRDVA
ncbi:hypothetical protein AB0M20_42790 [Actinoplanes sp. NPDC051633]|uniref:hypothetical protein n=1 Tax=Actinoplanes sp. NPDC051633 TaxID=3155670 RepID=UPI0034337FA2